MSPIPAAVCLLLVLGGCASNPDSATPGQDRQQAIAAYGRPTATYVLPQGERLQYSRQPAGRQVYNLDFDAAGKLQNARQVLSEQDFARVQIDAWRGPDVERAFGHPAEVGRVYSFAGPVWTYRYDQYGIKKQFHVLLDDSGVVRRTQITIEPEGNDRKFEP